MRFLIPILLAGTLHANPELLPAGYSVEIIPNPPKTGFDVTGLDVATDGAVYAGTRYGEIWRLPKGSESWSRFATGLHEITGLLIDPEHPNSVIIGQRPEFTRVSDTNKDGTADAFMEIASGWGFSGNYHEYTYGPVRDSKGNLYGTLNLGHNDNGFRVKGAIMGCDAKHRGTSFKVTPDGTYSTISWGLRSPAGICIDPRNDELFYTDNQGDFVATSALFHIKQDAFHGHPASLRYHPNYQNKDLNEISMKDYGKIRTPPAVWIPHGEIANSPGNPAFNLTGGKFGPFEGNLFVGDQTRSNIFRIDLEEVNGVYQGAAINFIQHLQSGCIRLAFDPDGSLWVGQTGRGWGSVGPATFGIQRIRWDGKTLPFEMKTVRLTKTGFDITFTKPAAAEDIKISGHSFFYPYEPNYGSGQKDRKGINIQSTTLSPDGTKLSIELADGDLKEGRNYRLELADSIRAKDGTKMSTRATTYTLNKLR